MLTALEYQYNKLVEEELESPSPEQFMKWVGEYRTTPLQDELKNLTLTPEDIAVFVQWIKMMILSEPIIIQHRQCPVVAEEDILRGLQLIGTKELKALVDDRIKAIEVARQREMENEKKGPINN
ncbi:MAG: hypothetical protein ACRBFS_20900 [Aureispira sp.]